MDWLEEWAKFETISNWIGLSIICLIALVAIIYVIYISVKNRKGGK